MIPCGTNRLRANGITERMRSLPDATVQRADHAVARAQTARPATSPTSKDDTMTEAPATINAHAGDDLSPVLGMWEVDPTHSSLEFSIRYAMFTKVRGRFSRYSGSINLDPLNLALTTVDVEIEAASVDSSMPLRDEHIRGDGFFEVERHPLIKFHGEGARPMGPGRFEIDGYLTIRGISQPVRLETDFFGQAPDMMGNPRLGFRATGKLHRSQWGINWNSPVPGGGVLLGEDVDLDLDVSLLPAGTIARIMAAANQGTAKP